MLLSFGFLNINNIRYISNLKQVRITWFQSKILRNISRADMMPNQLSFLFSKFRSISEKIRRKCFEFSRLSAPKCLDQSCLACLCQLSNWDKLIYFESYTINFKAHFVKRYYSKSYIKLLLCQIREVKD